MAVWTTCEVKALLRMRRQGLTEYAIAHHLKRSEDSVRGACARLGATVRPRWDGAEVAFLMDNYRSHGARWCAERLCRSEHAVRDKALRMGLRLDLAGLERGDG